MRLSSVPFLARATPPSGGGSVTYVGAGTTYVNYSSLTSHSVAVPSGMSAGDRLIVVAGNLGTVSTMVTNESQSLTAEVVQTGSIWSVVLAGTVPTSVTVTLSSASEFRAQALAFGGVPVVDSTSNEDVIGVPRDAIQYSAGATSGAVVVAYAKGIGQNVTAALFNGTDAADYLVKFDFDSVGVIAGIHDGATGSNDIDLTWSDTDGGGRYITAVYEP